MNEITRLDENNFEIRKTIPETVEVTPFNIVTEKDRLRELQNRKAAQEENVKATILEIEALERQIADAQAIPVEVAPREATAEENIIN